MAATAEHRLTLDPMGKYSNAFLFLLSLVPIGQVVLEKKLEM
jgi:hypothetical protein